MNSILTVVVWLVILYGLWKLFELIVGSILGSLYKLIKPNSNVIHDLEYPEPLYKVEPLPFTDYPAYISSDKWKKLAWQRKAIDNSLCQYCRLPVISAPGHHNSSNCHHLHYRTLGNESVRDDLVTLCKSCHTTLHALHSVYEMEQEINSIRIKHQ